MHPHGRGMGLPWAGRPRRGRPNPLISGHDRPRPHGHAMGLRWGPARPWAGSVRPPSQAHGSPCLPMGRMGHDPTLACRPSHRSGAPMAGFACPSVRDTEGSRRQDARQALPGGGWVDVRARVREGLCGRPRASPDGSIYPHRTGLFRHRTLAPFGHRLDPRQHQHPPRAGPRPAPRDPAALQARPRPRHPRPGQAPRPSRAAGLRPRRAWWCSATP